VPKKINDLHIVKEKALPDYRFMDGARHGGHSKEGQDSRFLVVAARVVEMTGLADLYFSESIQFRVSQV
jgi:hypothetical protein